MKFIGDIDYISEGIEILNCGDENIVVSVKKGDYLKVSGDALGYNIEYGDKTDFFRGISVLISQISMGNVQLLGEKCSPTRFTVIIKFRFVWAGRMTMETLCW